MLLNNKECGQRLVQLEQHLKLNSRQFAISIEADPSYISKMEKGEKGISRAYQDKIAEKYGVNIKWLMLGDGQMFGQNVPRESSNKSDGKEEKEKDLTAQALLNLTESNKLMAESIKVKEDSFKIYAATHAELVLMAKGKQFPSAIDDQRNQLHLFGTVLGIRSLLEEIAAKVYKQPLEQVQDALDKKVTEELNRLESKGRNAAEGKTSKIQA